MGFSVMDSFMFNIFPIIFMVMFVTIFIIFLITIIGKLKQGIHNKKQPVLSVEASVVDKRSDHRTSHNHNNNMHSTHHYTYYYVTFQVESGDRMEFEVESTEYGLIAMGDVGKVTFQGTAFKGFERSR